MSFIVDRNISSWECFDVNTATTLFWKRIPFVYKAEEREEIHEDFTVRILSGVTKNNHNLRVIRIHISTEADLLFLHTLEVTEEDFQGLKAEQGILVDFSNFPGKLITLLEKCISSGKADFQAELTTSGTESCLKIVETNDFNKLPHVSLKFRPGNDSMIKSFLAFRLSEVEQKSQSLTTRLAQSQLECTKLSEMLKEKDRCCSSWKEKAETGRLEGEAETKRIRLDADQRLAEIKEQLRATFEAEKRESEEKFKSQIETLTQRNEELELENRKLRDEKYALDKKCSEIQHRLATTEGEKTFWMKECEDLRRVNSGLVEEKQQLTFDLTQAKIEIRSLQEKECTALQVKEVQTTRLTDLESSKSQLEKSYEEMKMTLVCVEKSGKQKDEELKQREFVIQKLARDLRLAKERQCSIRSILSRQEDVMAQKDHQLRTVQEENSNLEHSVDSLRNKNEALSREMNELRQKLKESAQQLNENQSMIDWLHRQINDASLPRRKFKHESPQHENPLQSPRMARKKLFSLPQSGSGNVESCRSIAIEQSQSNGIDF